MQESNEFENFDTKKLLNKLEDNDTKMVVLLSCRRFGMTTQPLAERDAPNSREGYVYNSVRKALTWLTHPPEGSGWPPLLEVKTPKLSGRNGRPPNLWMLTKYGAYVLNLLEPGLEIQPPNPRDALDLAHRFCILDILGLALTSNYPAWGEHSLVSGEQTVRADVFVQAEFANVVIEVEQRLLQRNLGRAVRKFENWERYIRAAKQSGEQLPWRLYLLFNVRAVSLNNLLGKWRNALTRATENMGGLSYQVYYGQTGRISEMWGKMFYQDASLDENSLLEADTQDNYWPSADEPDWLPDFIGDDLYADFEDAMEAVCNAEIDMGLPPLIHLAMMIYQASYYRDSPPMNFAAFPRASLWLMRRYLEHPWMLPVRARLVKEFKKIRKRSPGLTMFRDQVTRLIWDALLRHHGLGRGGALRAVFQVPDFQDISSDFRVDVHIGGSVRGNTEEAEKAMSWCLSSLYLYMEDLGLYASNQEEGEQ